MLSKEFYLKVSEGNITDEVKAYALKKLEPTPEQVARSAEYDEIIKAIRDYYEANPTKQVTQTELGSAIGKSASKVGYALRTYLMGELDRVRDIKTGTFLYSVKPKVEAEGENE